MVRDPTIIGSFANTLIDNELWSTIPYHFFVFVFSLFVSLVPFLYFIECVCYACRIQYDDMALPTVLTAYIRGNVLLLIEYCVVVL